MAQVTLGGNPVNTVGELPAVGSAAPSYTLAGADLSDVTPDSFSGKKVVLNIFPSIDTPTCATSVRTFNKAVADRDNAVVCASRRTCRSRRPASVAPRVVERGHRLGVP